MRLFTSQEITCYVTVLNEKKSKRITRIPAKLIYRVASSLKIILPVYKIRYDYTINTMRLVQLTNIKYYIMSSENFCFFYHLSHYILSELLLYLGSHQQELGLHSVLIVLLWAL